MKLSHSFDPETGTHRMTLEATQIELAGDDDLYIFWNRLRFDWDALNLHYRLKKEQAEANRTLLEHELRHA